MKKETEPKEKPKMKSPIDLFFKLGDWATKGDPIRSQNFQYYMLWILFLAFVGMFGLNSYNFIMTIDFSYLIWATIGFAIASLQYFNLKNFYQMRKARKDMPKIKAGEEHKVEDVDEMLKSFKKEDPRSFSGEKEKSDKEVKNDIRRNKKTKERT